MIVAIANPAPATGGTAGPGPTTTRLVVDSPIGTLTLAGSDESVSHLFLPHTGMSAAGTSPRQIPVPLRRAAAQLEGYFAGRRTAFDLPLAPSGTPFQRAVWLALADIPYGETVSYAELARRVGRPAAFRAVGQANGANPLPIFYPCHRVVASSGGLGGYGGGLDVKRQLLALEAWSGPR
jgi:methylated-DNA-[protein]-cysteine S-methyltransferase